MDLGWVFVFVAPVVLSLLVVFSQALRNNTWAFAGLCFVVIVAFGVMVSLEPSVTSIRKLVQVILFAALPYGALWLVSRLAVVADRPYVFIAVGPATFWLSYGVAVNLWLALGYGF